MKLPCKVIEDMLPMYHDKICSAESVDLVETHLKDCPHCSRVLADLRADMGIPEAKVDDAKPLKKIQKHYKKMRLGWLIAIVCVLVLTPIAFLIGNNQSEQSDSFVDYPKEDALAYADQFMHLLVTRDYANAYTYWDIDEEKYQLLLDGRLTEADLANFKADGLEKFCHGGSALDALGGIESFVLEGISDPSYANRHGTESYHIAYKIIFNGKEASFGVNVTKYGITHISTGDGRIDHPLTELTLWVQWVVDDYRGKYYNRETNQWEDAIGES